MHIMVPWFDQVKKVLILKFLSIEINQVFLGMDFECVNLLIIFTINQRLAEKCQVQ